MRTKGRSVGSLVPCVQKLIPHELKRLQGRSSARRLRQSSVSSPVSKRTRSRIQGSLSGAGQKKQQDATERRKEIVPKQNDDKFIKKSVSSSTDNHVLESDMSDVHQVIASGQTRSKRVHKKTKSFTGQKRKRGRPRKDEQSSEPVKRKREVTLCFVSNEERGTKTVPIDSISGGSFTSQSDTRVPPINQDSTASDSGSPVRGTENSSISMCQEKSASLQSPQKKTSEFGSAHVTRAEETVPDTDESLNLDHPSHKETPGDGCSQQKDNEAEGDEATDFFTFEVEYPAPSTPQQKMARKLARQRQLEQMRMREVVFARRERLLRRQGVLSKVERSERKVKWKDGNLVQIFTYGTETEEEKP